MTCDSHVTAGLRLYLCCPGAGLDFSAVKPRGGESDHTVEQRRGRNGVHGGGRGGLGCEEELLTKVGA